MFRKDAPIIICSPNTDWLTHLVMQNKSDSAKFGGSGGSPPEAEAFCTFAHNILKNTRLKTGGVRTS